MVRIELHARRVFCLAAACPRQTFAERLPEVAAISARTTARLRETHQRIGQALGGKAGARLAAPLGISTSPDALLRRVVAGLRQDEVAVKAALSLEWSNGPVEGRVNRLKRRMYGPAGFDLLRRRFLQAG